METIEILIDIMKKLDLNVDSFDEEQPIENYITNSYQQVKFIIEIEKKFDIEIPESLVLATDEITIKQFSAEIDKMIK